MSSMHHIQMNMSDMEAMKGHDISMYNLYTINVKTGSAIDKLVVKEGQKIRIRLVNAGYLMHTIHLNGQRLLYFYTIRTTPSTYLG
ncbi:hypothetical protein [Brevibacillus sp. SKDU10]|uniref:hypothetical protein n=1 Tax=Brevibacillus sp. SKDU10 TaxID=1247872 RepID=UPI00350EE899